MKIGIEANLVDQIYNMLKERIINLELKLGQRVNIKKLAGEFGVSQTPIREALNRLTKDGLVTVIPRRGYYVVKLSAEEMEEIYDLRKMFESYALESGIENIDPNKLRILKQKTENLQNETNKRKKRTRFDKTDRDLHLLIVQSSPNKRLHEMYFKLYDFVKISQRMNPEFEKALEEHIALLDSLLEKNIEKAQHLLKIHIDNAMNEGIKALKRGLYDNKAFISSS